MTTPLLNNMDGSYEAGVEVDQALRQGQSVDVCQTGPSHVYDSGSMPVNIMWMFNRSG